MQKTKFSSRSKTKPEIPVTSNNVLLDLSLITAGRSQNEALELLNCLYTEYQMCDNTIDDNFEDKAIIARFFLDLGMMIKLSYQIASA